MENSNSSRSACLLVLTGPDKGALHQLQVGTQLLGGPRAQIALRGRDLSPAHAEITYDPDEIEVRDLGSEAGTLLNGTRISQATLQPGDTLKLGSELELRLDTPDLDTQSLMQDLYLSATRDFLTGLLNRRSFLERLEQECAVAGRHGLETCLALLEVDNFKEFNEKWGHAAGDSVLVELARRLTSAIRIEDVLGRFGGEQFIAIIRHAPLEGATLLMERIRASVEERALLTSQSLQKVTVSIGVTVLTPSLTPEMVVNAGRRALNEARREGRNRVSARRM